jgi:hypothetical protein
VYNCERRGPAFTIRCVITSSSRKCNKVNDSRFTRAPNVIRIEHIIVVLQTLPILLKIYYLIPSLDSRNCWSYTRNLGLYDGWYRLSTHVTSVMFLPSDITALQLQLSRQENSRIYAVRTAHHNKCRLKLQRGERKSCFCLHDLM